MSYYVKFCLMLQVSENWQLGKHGFLGGEIPDPFAPFVIKFYK